VPVAACEVPVGAPPDLPGRDDVEDGQSVHAVGVVERHSVGHAPTAVVADDREAVMTEGGHRLDLVDRHGPLAVRGVVVRRRGTERRAVARQVGGDDRMPLGEQRRDGVPHQMRLRIAVQQQHRWPAASDLRVQRPTRGRQLVGLEAGEQGHAATLPDRSWGAMPMTVCHHRPRRLAAG
jgi:hypothetical protein